MALPASETFTAANGTLLTAVGSNWASVRGNFAIQSNEAGPNGGGNDVAVRWSADTFSNDQYAKATVKAITGGDYVGVAVRCSNSAESWYEVIGDASDGTYFYKVVAGTGSELAATAGPLAVNDVVEIRAVGTTISWYKNTVLQASVTDTSLTSGYAGVAGSGTNSSRLDSWEGGNLGSVGITATLARTLVAATVSSAATLALSGTLTRTLTAATLSANATLLNPNSGGLAVTLGAVTISSTALLIVTGNATITLGTIVISSSGSGPGNTGNATITLGTATLTGVLYRLSAACTAGVLTVSSNGRYFQNSSGPLVLSGMHTWYTIQDGGPSDPPPVTDWDEFLAAMSAYGHNATRLFRLETAREWGGFPDQVFGQNAYARTGPGNAADGHLKFDLDKWNHEYFERLHSRVIEAGNQGIYCIVQLFQGWHIDNKGYGTGDPWPYHPFDDANNINGVSGDPNSDGDGYEMRDTSQTALYNRNKLFVEKVVTLLNNLDNVIYEISNEDMHSAAALAWQRGMVAYIETLEAGLPKQHAIGLSKLFPGGSNADLFASTDATWIGIDDDANPDVATGAKVILWDTDHVFGITTTHEWVLRAFCQGHNPIFMDVWEGYLYGTDMRADAQHILIRRLMGDALAYSRRMTLASATPNGALSTTGWCLAKTTSPAHLFVYQSGTGAFNVTLTSIPGTFTLEWYRVTTGETQAGSNVTGSAVRTLTPPWSGQVAAFLQQVNAGSFNVTLGALTLSASSTASINASAAITLGAVAISSTATLPLLANASIALSAATLSSAGQLALTAQTTITLGTVTVIATGASVTGPSGALNVTLSDATISITGTIAIAAQADFVLGPLTLSSLSTLAIVASVTVTLGAVTLAATESPLVFETTAGAIYGPSSTASIFGP